MMNIQKYITLQRSMRDMKYQMTSEQVIVIVMLISKWWFLKNFAATQDMFLVLGNVRQHF